jgi:calcium-translocating P-type ATPase
MDWYKLSSQDVFGKLETGKDGLSGEEAALRLKKYGPNILPQAKRFKVWRFLWLQFKSPLIFILIIAGFITLGIKEYFDMIIIFASVIVNIGIGFYQEYSSGKTLEKLARMVKVEARVMRDGELREIDSEELVPGDIVHLKTGMKVPADLRLFSIKDFRTNEALLTGESNPVEKTVEIIKHGAVTADRKNMAFMGTTVEKGEAIGVVVGLGKATEIGKIAELTKRAEEKQTPLQERLARLGTLISILVLIAAILIIVAGLYRDVDFFEIFITSVAVAVAAIPEGLPAALAVILAVSSQKILRKGGLVKQLVAAESLGSTSVICVDKTGTLTEGKMKIEKIITKSDEDMLIEIMALSNEAIVEKTGDGYAIKGDSTDQAKMQKFLDSGKSIKELLKNKPLLNLLPFDSVNKYVASLNKITNDKIGLYVTGAPEVFLNKAKVSKEEIDSIKSDYESLAQDGYRMIGVGYRELDMNVEEASSKSEEQIKGLVGELTFMGLAAIRDPIRKEVKEIMKDVRNAGLRVVMVTGDHKLTATAIGKELGMATDGLAVMEGYELNNISDEDLREKIKEVDVFARVDPEHKLRVVNAWKKRGESVAVTGDGINDAPALKTADIGIALASGTDVTKEASDLVLVDNSFVTIVEAIRQGRTAFGNIKKVVIFLLSNSFTELILILGSLLLKIPLPITAVQILWTNLVEDGLPNFALAFEPPEKKIMKRKPIERKAPLLDSQGKFLAYPLGIMTDIVLLGVFIAFLKMTSYDITYIRTFMFAALGTDSLFYIFSLKSLDRSVFKTNPFNNIYLLVAIAIGFVMMYLAIYLPQLNTVLKTQPLILKHALLILGLGFYKLLLVDLVKYIYAKKYDRI